jgi:trans-2,3-dihydro-3-hydroxyanthranilate isomerase
MQEIARAVGFNETAFVMASTTADLRLRYFTPGHEIPLCGHGTMAALAALQEHGGRDLTGRTLSVQTQADTLAMSLEQTPSGIVISMDQAAPSFKPFDGNRDRLAAALGLGIEDLDADLPILYGSTGTWTLLVPIRSLDAFDRMTPVNADFPDILLEMPRTSVHPFCLQTIDPDAHMHARHFSSPFSGTVEDPVTGTASGVMGAYTATVIKRAGQSLPGLSRPDGSLRLVVEQGTEIGRRGRVEVFVRPVNGSFAVSIRGQAVFNRRFSVDA